MERGIFILPLAGFLAIAACDEPPTALQASDSRPSLAADLDLELPELTQGLFSARESDPTSSARALARAEEDRDEIFSRPDMLSGVYAPKTVPGFERGYAYARGENWYSGNKGRFETTADVSYQDQLVGSQSAFSEGYELFLMDFGRWKFLSATARVYSGRECGLSVTGRSEHTAWWEFFTGVGVATWGKTARTTSAPPVFQAPCPTPDSFAHGGGEEGGSAALACWYLVTYDLHTGTVYDTELLYCDHVTDIE